MKKKKIFILLLVVIFALLFALFVFHESTYTISVEKVDGFSPDRKLVVYRNNKKIKFEELKYKDGTYLCSSENPTVSYSDIFGIKELIIKISDKKQVVAKIVEK